MNGSNYFRFNPLRCEEHLSPYGRQVLKVLIKQWNNPDHVANKVVLSQKSYRSAQTLTFRDKNIVEKPSTPANYQIDYNSNYELNDEIPFVSNSTTNNDENNVLKSIELVETVEDTNKPEELINFSSDDLVVSVVDRPSKHRRFLQEVYNKTSDDEETVFNVDCYAEADKPNTDTAKVISWDDMFDTELFPKSMNIANTEDEVIQIKQGDIEKKKNFEIQFTTGGKIDKNSKKSQKVNKALQIKDIEPQNTNKRKNQSKITDSIAKKVKKQLSDATKIITKNSFRKQKYTKTVKIWLNDVDPKHYVEDNTTHEHKIGDNDETQANNNVYTTVMVEKDPKVKVKKKVIQAQLANKGGVMKFGKPNNVEVYSILNNTKEPIPLGTKTADKDNTKDKKTKTKFIAPIKSQIPVQDVAYSVYTLKETNIKEHINYLEKVQNAEVITILVYSNGLCQLNNHHTDDTCIPDGIILQIDDRFYYFDCNTEEYGYILTEILKNNTIVCYDGKNVLTYLMSRYCLEINRTINIIDTKIGGGLVDPDNPPENFTELQKLLSFTPQYTIATECRLQKTAWYMTLLMECVTRLRTLLIESLLWNVFIDIEMPLLPVIANMERQGVCVDLEKLKSMEDVLLKKLKEVEQDCYQAAGKVFQINSTVQVRAILYDELKLDTKCNVKIKETISKGAKSTSETMLRNLMSIHPLPKLILEYRHLHKAHSTFLSGIAQHVKNGVVRPTWVQTAAATGRIASNNPNLQAIPKTPFSLIMFPEDDNNENQLLNFRSVYTSRENHTFLTADFRHIECRVFAHAAADTSLLDALKNGDDLFRVLAAKWLNKAESAVSNEDRERTKRIVYASLYGAGTKKLMDILDVSYDQALSVIASFNRTFPSLKSFGRSVVARCEQNGGKLSTMCGRVRLFKNISSAEFTLKSQAERQAVNFIVQGTAADLCKKAMVMTEEQLRCSNPPVDGHLVLQIHDELVWEIRDHDLKRAASIIKAVMENCGLQCGIPITLPIAISCGRNWGELTEYTPK